MLPAVACAGQSAALAARAQPSSLLPAPTHGAPAASAHAAAPPLHASAPGAPLAFPSAPPAAAATQLQTQPSAYELACIWPAAALAAAAGDAGRHGHDALGAGSDATSAAAADVQLGLPPVAPPSLAAPILAPAGSAPAVLQRPAGVLLWPQLRQATTQAAATTNGVDTGAGEAQQPHLQQQLLQLQQQQQWWQLADVPAAPCSSPGVAAGAAAAAAAAVAGDAQQAAAPMQWQGWEQLGPLPACLVTPTAAPAGGGGVDGADPAAPLSAGTVAALMAMFSP